MRMRDCWQPLKLFVHEYDKERKKEKRVKIPGMICDEFTWRFPIK